MNNPRAAWLHQGLMALATLLLLFSLAVYGVYAVNLMQFPFDYDQGEGFELVDTVLFSQAKLPYQNTEVYPFYSSNYSPLYHVLAAPFVWFFGEAYWYGRFLSFVSTLITAGLIAYAVYREASHRWIAMLSGLAFLASNTIYHIAPLFRQHISMVMWETLAVVLLAHAFPQRRKWLIAAGFAALVAAGYTKQLAIITAAAVLLWLLLRNPRRAVIWGAGFALCGGVIFLWLNVSTSGEWWRQAIAANVGGINPLQVFALFVLWFKLHGFLLIPAALLLIFELYFTRLSLYSVWFGVAVLLGGSASGTWGGGDSYFATSIAAMCILSGIFCARTINRTWQFKENYLSRLIPAALKHLSPVRQIIMMILIPLLYIGYARTTLKMPTQGAIFGSVAAALNIQPNVMGRFYDSASYDVPGYANIGYLTTPEDTAAGNRIVELIRSTDRPVLSEEAGFSLVAGRDVITNPTQLLNLWRAGLFKGDALIAMIEQREFGLIILRAQFYPVPVLEAIGRHYEIAEAIPMNGFEYLIFYPVE